MKKRHIIAAILIILLFCLQSKPLQTAEILGETRIEEHKSKAAEKTKEFTQETKEFTQEFTQEITQEVILIKKTPETYEDKQAVKFMNSDLGEWIIDYSYESGIDPYLVLAIAERESSFRTSCIGDNGNSIGIMQVQPKWNAERMERLEVKDLTDPEDCVRVAIDILLEYAQENSDLYYVLMAYNGGQQYANKYYEKSPSEYAVEVTKRATILCELYEGALE